jgi:uracil-DNA glycosylase family 4
MDFKDLRDIFNPRNPKCGGCSILDKALPQHSIMDYEGKRECEILFVSDSLKMYDGDYVPFRANEYNVIMKIVRSTAFNGKMPAFTAAVKCPNIKKQEMTGANRKICRQHLETSIAHFKPKLVFACGDLATNMFYGKDTKLTKIRGQARDFEMGNHKFRLVTIFHPWQVVAEPKNHYLFELDIKNNIEFEIFGITRKSGFEFFPIMSIEELKPHEADFIDTEYPISVDIETTGLNFLEDTIHTISFSVLDPEQFAKGILIAKKTIAFPIDHFEAKLGLQMKAKFMDFVCKVMKNRRNKKVGVNIVFDLKFLKKYGVDEVYNIWDCRLMQHCANEDVPKNLKSLVTYYYPNETV